MHLKTSKFELIEFESNTIYIIIQLYSSEYNGNEWVKGITDQCFQPLKYLSTLLKYFSSSTISNIFFTTSFMVFIAKLRYPNGRNIFQLLEYLVYFGPDVTTNYTIFQPLEAFLGIGLISFLRKGSTQTPERPGVNCKFFGARVRSMESSLEWQFTKVFISMNFLTNFKLYRSATTIMYT